MGKLVGGRVILSSGKYRQNGKYNKFQSYRGKDDMFPIPGKEGVFLET